MCSNQIDRKASPTRSGFCRPHNTQRQRLYHTPSAYSCLDTALVWIRKQLPSVTPFWRPPSVSQSESITTHRVFTAHRQCLDHTHSASSPHNVSVITTHRLDTERHRPEVAPADHTMSESLPHTAGVFLCHTPSVSLPHTASVFTTHRQCFTTQHQRLYHTHTPR